jgi:hypothetical protein
MKKLTVILGMLGVFALGCATASVMIDRAEATPVSGSHECLAFEISYASKNDVEKGKHEGRGMYVPPGWTPVGGGFGPVAVVIACRPVP